MYKGSYIPTKPNIPSVCLMAKPSEFVVLNLCGEPGEQRALGEQYYEQGFALTPGILQPDVVENVDLSQESMTVIIQTLTSGNGSLPKKNGSEFIGHERLAALKAQIMERLSESLLCSICPLSAQSQCSTRFIIDAEQTSIGVFPTPVQGVAVTELHKPSPPTLPRRYLPLAG
jgi:hypothetical protein